MPLMMMMMMMMIPEVCPVHRLEKGILMLPKNCHQMPTSELDGFHKTYDGKTNDMLNKSTHMYHKTEVQEFFTLPSLQVLQEMRNRIASYEAI